MKTRNIPQTGYRLSAILCLALIVSSCTSEIVEDRLPDGTPVTVKAEIDPAPPVSRAVDVSNAYDRTTFVADDQIRITKKYNTTTKSVFYKYNGTEWAAVGNDQITLQAGATYQARYPYSDPGIERDQSTAANYLKSNLLETEVITSRDGVLNFTGDNAFKHKNTKITLSFSGEGATLNGDFSNFTISAIGLRTGSSTEEQITFYRLDAGTYDWCGIVYPIRNSTEISLSLTYDGVDYNTTIACPMAVGTHYKYTLKIKNNLLVPTGTEIAKWKDETVYTGDFDKN